MGRRTKVIKKGREGGKMGGEGWEGGAGRRDGEKGKKRTWKLKEEG